MLALCAAHVFFIFHALMLSFFLFFIYRFYGKSKFSRIGAIRHCGLDPQSPEV